MSKGTKYVLIMILVAIVILAMYVGYQESEPNSGNVPVGSTNTVTNTTTNEINNNIPQNNNIIDNNIVETEPTKEIIKSETLTDEEKAKELVRQEWGGSEGVYFSIDNMNSDETYIVSVRDSATTKVLEWYKVDIKTGEVSVN